MQNLNYLFDHNVYEGGMCEFLHVTILYVIEEGQIHNH